MRKNSPKNHRAYLTIWLIGSSISTIILSILTYLIVDRTLEVGGRVHFSHSRDKDSQQTELKVYGDGLQKLPPGYMPVDKIRPVQEDEVLIEPLKPYEPKKSQ